MDGKNRAASSYLSPGNPPADKEQNDPLCSGQVILATVLQ